MPTIELAGLTIFILLLFAGVYLTIFGLPGTILILFDVFLYALFTGFGRIDIKAIVILAVMTIVAEALGFTLEMTSTYRFGPSLKGMLASLIGALLGALALTPVLWGLGTLMGIFLGGFSGFLILELIRQGRLKPAFRASSVAIITTAAAIFIKGSFAVAMTIVTLSNIYS
ncbi:MAG TPA: DUF456 domain-containing protein [Syntrophales bacterium]|nr:DUF456 domain-containing protein [Syntrophales bacterium]